MNNMNNMNNTTTVPLVHALMPAELDGRCLGILKTSSVMNVWCQHPGQSADSGHIEVPPEATGATLVVSAGPWSSISIEGSQDQGRTWERLAARSSMLGFVTATYEPQPAHGQTPAVRLSHLRVKASRASKGAVKVGIEVIRL